MNKVIIAKREGITQHVRLLTTGYTTSQKPRAYVAGMDFQWYDYIPLKHITVYKAWRGNLKGSPTMTLCNIAHDHYKDGNNIFKGWAALVLLTEDVTELIFDELECAMIAAEQHSKTLVGRNAFKILKEELHRRELGEIYE